jgi:3-oxoacyl-[acyl-carrier-protein] synthase-3
LLPSLKTLANCASVRIHKNLHIVYAGGRAMKSFKLWKYLRAFLSRKKERNVDKTIGIRGTGYSVPENIRYNNDPIFSHIISDANSQGIAERDLFSGMKERRFLQRNEQIETFMVEAAQHALSDAQVAPTSIDRLYGYASVSPYITPNAIYAVHRKLDLSERTMVVPINSEFSNFVMGIIYAWEAIEAGHSQNALVVCGCNWTRYMDYTQGHAFSVGDGAGAAVIGREADFVLVDYATQTLSEQYGVMNMQTRVSMVNGRSQILVDEHNIPIPTYEITPEAGVESFRVTAMYGLPDMVQALLKRNDLTGKDVALITHQASRVLMDCWESIVQPKEYLDTLELFGNTALAAYPITLAYHYPVITADYLVFAALGVGYHQVALLLKRNRVHS